MSNASDFVIENGVLMKYVSPGGDVIIPDGVITIGGDAFRGCSSLKSVTIPENVNAIGWHSFRDCTNLTSVNISEGVKEICNYAFLGCSSLKSVTIPESVASIGDEAFEGTALLEDENRWEGDLFYLGKLLMRAKNTLKGVCEIKPGTRFIGTKAFYNCSGMTEVNIPNSVTSIGYGAFSGCGMLTDLIVPDSVMNLGRGAFSGCSNLERIHLSKNVGIIQPEMFRRCYNLTNVTIPKDITYIGDWAFADCRSLTDMVIPDSVTNISGSTFVNCDCLRVTIPDKVSFNSSWPPFECCRLEVTVRHWSPEISKMFRDCQITAIHTEDISQVPAKYRYLAAVGFASEENVDLNTARAEKHIDYIRKNAGKLCDAVKDRRTALYFLCEQNLIGAKDIDNYLEIIDKQDDPELKAILLNYQNALGNEKVSNARAKKEKVKEVYAEALVERLAARDPSKGIEGMVFVISGNLSNIWESRKEVQTYLESYGASLGSSVTKKTDYLVTNDIDSGSEKNRKAKEYGAQVINETDFNDMVGIRFKDTTQITIPIWLKEIHPLAFYGCSSLTSVTIPDGVQNIGESAFNGCSSLTSVTIPDSVRTIGESAFNGCNSLTEVTIPEGLMSIAYNVFSNCSGLKTAGPIGGGYNYQFAWRESIPNLAFWECKNLERITIPDSIASIGVNSFYNCSSLSNVTIPSSVTSIGSGAFSGCSSLTSVAIPKGVTSISEYMFKDCNSLTRVSIPDGVTSIGSSAFQNCSNLTSVTIPDGVTNIGWAAFSKCNSLTEVTIPEGVTSISSQAFNGCSNLIRVTIPASVTFIGFDAFANCPNLTVFVPAGSHAEKVAKKKNIPFAVQ